MYQDVACVWHHAVPASPLLLIPSSRWCTSWCAESLSATSSAQRTCALLQVLTGGADQHMVQLWIQLVWVCLGCLGLPPDVEGRGSQQEGRLHRTAMAAQAIRPLQCPKSCCNSQLRDPAVWDCWANDSMGRLTAAAPRY